MSSVYGVILTHREAHPEEILAMGGASHRYDRDPIEPLASLAPSRTEVQPTGPRVHDQVGWGPGWRLGDRVLLWDGEIYNQAQLARTLNLPLNTGEPELVLRGLERHGQGFLVKLNGPCAMGVLDLRAGTWLLARGNQGLRPLFWYESPEGIAFAQDIPTLLRCPWGRPEPNWERIPEYLVFQNVAGGATLYRNVRELLPGQLLSGYFSRPESALATYDSPRQITPCSAKERDLPTRAERLLGAVTSRLCAPDPREHIALFLSGGVDSSLIALALKDRNPVSLTVTCEGYRHDESPHARLVRDTLSLSGAEIPLNPEAFATGWVEAIQTLNLPLTSTNQVPWWILCKEAKSRGLSVAFSGEGSDGWFAGGLYDEERKAVAGLWAKDQDEVACRVILCRTHVLNDPELVHRITTLPLKLESRTAMWQEILDASDRKSVDDMTVLYHVRTVGHRLLTRADLVATSHGIRLRLPYLEDDWLRWVRSIPYSLRNGEGVRKQPLKALCALQWGEEFAHRKKIGFPFPLRTWIRQGETTLLREWLGMLTDDLALRRGMYRAEALRHEIRSRVEGQVRPADWLLWSLINLELWLRHLEGCSTGG